MAAAAAGNAEILTVGRGFGACTSRTTPGDTLKLLGVSIASPIDESTAANTDLQKQLALLSSQTMLLTNHKNNLKKEIYKLGTQTQRIQRRLLKSTRLKFLPVGFFPSPLLLNLSITMSSFLQGAVVHFVDLLTKANIYFEFKEFAIRVPEIERTSNSIELSHVFLKNQRLMSMFPEMDKSEVTKAANALYGVLGNQEPEDDPLLSDYIYNLVFQTREKGYHMHMDPMTELKKMMQSEPWFYDNHFCLQNLPMEFSDESIQEACHKYACLVRLMHDKYKKTVGVEIGWTAWSSRKRSFETGVIDEVSRKRK